MERLTEPLTVEETQRIAEVYAEAAQQMYCTFDELLHAIAQSLSEPFEDILNMMNALNDFMLSSPSICITASTLPQRNMVFHIYGLRERPIELKNKDPPWIHLLMILYQPF